MVTVMRAMREWESKAAPVMVSRWSSRTSAKDSPQRVW